VNDIVTTLRALASGLVPAVEEKAMRDAATEIIRLEGSVLDLTAERDRQTEIIITLRQELKEAKARNTMYLSKIQEFEAREY
jgi:hypothetical protein